MTYSVTKKVFSDGNLDCYFTTITTFSSFGIYFLMHYKVRAGFHVLVASGLAGFLGDVEHLDCLQVIPQKTTQG